MKWVQDDHGFWDLRDQQGRLVGWAMPAGSTWRWEAPAPVQEAREREWPRLVKGSEANVEAAKAAVEAAVWARAAEGLAAL